MANPPQRINDWNTVLDLATLRPSLGDILATTGLGDMPMAHMRISVHERQHEGVLREFSK